MSNSLTELVLLFPDKEELLELWVEEVVPLIMDREIKVQEQTLQVTHKRYFTFLILFNNIDKNHFYF